MISIIMPAYNSENTINESVQSVLKQTYTEWELIIIDDCSEKPVQAYADERIKVLRNNVNRGVARSRNRGVEDAQGEWLAFIDSDDCWLPQKLERQMAFMTKHNALISYTSSGFISDEGEKYNYVMPVLERITYKELLKCNLMSCSSVICERRLLLKYPFPDRVNTHEDFCVWLRIIKENGCAYGLDEPLLIYRLGNSSKSSNRMKSALMTYNAYREVGCNQVVSLAMTVRYAVWSIWKRRQIYDSGVKVSKSQESDKSMQKW